MLPRIEVLILEDRREDAELMAYHLAGSGFEVEWECVETESEYTRRLESPPDIILADYRVPEFDAPRALELLQASGLDIPFIVVSGTIGEDIAAEMMRRGASDYLLKDRLLRLGPAVSRALAERDLRAERRQVQEALLKQTEEIHDLYDHAPCGYHTTDADGVLIRINETELAWLGYTRDELTGRRFADLLTAESRQTFGNAIECLTGAGDIRAFECDLLRKDGTCLPALVNIAAVRDGNGTAGKIRATVYDITERRGAAIVRREQESLLRSVLEALPLGVTVIDPSGNTIIRNRAAEGAPGFHARRMRVPDTGEEVPMEDWVGRRVIEDGSEVLHQILEITLGESTPAIVRDSAVALRDIDKKITGAVIVEEDITESRVLEEQCRQSQKMEAIGRLAGAMAHDFNNLLTVICGYGSLLAASLAETPAGENACEIVRAAESASELTRGLLAFSRRQAPHPKIVDLNAILRETGKMVRLLAGEKIKLEMVLDPALHRIIADPLQIEQIILNLASNSRDAMPDGGTLIIRTGNSQFSPALKLPPQPCVMLSVSDTGCGMDVATQSRIFEPFFTTKPHGLGTGLGLSTVHGIIQQSGGDISVSSTPGQGATFVMHFPFTTRQAETPVCAPLLAARPVSGTILLVEDMDGLRRLAAQTLRQAGNEVLEARSGSRAVSLFHKNRGRIDLLLTDVIMPGMNGADLAVKLRTLEPELQVLYMSANPSSFSQSHLASLGIHLLAKPFSPETLVARVQQLMSPRRDRRARPAGAGL